MQVTQHICHRQLQSSLVLSYVFNIFLKHFPIAFVYINLYLSIINKQNIINGVKKWKSTYIQDKEQKLLTIVLTLDMVNITINDSGFVNFKKFRLN